jgi:hypothetical protein
MYIGNFVIDELLIHGIGYCRRCITPCDRRKSPDYTDGCYAAINYKVASNHFSPLSTVITVDVYDLMTALLRIRRCSTGSCMSGISTPLRAQSAYTFMGYIVSATVGIANMLSTHSKQYMLSQHGNFPRSFVLIQNVHAFCTPNSVVPRCLSAVVARFVPG